MHRRLILKSGLALGASLVIPPARACEYFTSTLRVLHPWTRATGLDTSAVICMTFDQASLADRLTGVETPVAGGAQLVGNLLIPKGGELVLREDGPHVRLVDLKHPLFIARSYPLTLKFEKGDVVQASLNVDFLRVSR